MEFIEDTAALEALYGAPAPTATKKVADRLVPVYSRWIAASRFAVLVTVGPEGTDSSPRGDEGPVAVELDDRTLALPDWRGNNRIDSLRNILRDARVSLMFMVPGSTNVVRVNGTARLSADAALLARFGKDGKRPRTVAVISVAEVYFQCARALVRSRLWTSGDESAGLPTAGEMLAEVSAGSEGGAEYDHAWPKRAAESLW
jgi:PPOX class probable FMN-dependent enzyme